MPGPNHGLFRFGGAYQPGGFPWGDRINAAGLAALRPAACPANRGMRYLATDQSGGTVYRSTGSAWQQEAGAVTIPDGSILLSALESRARPFASWILNGDMGLAQRQAPATLTTISQDAYGPDRFRVCRENADVQYQRTDTAASPEAGLVARYYGTFKKVTNTGKIAVVQPIEAADSLLLLTRTITIRFKAKASTGPTGVRFGLLNLTGTADTFPAAFVSTWFGTGVDPTWGTNLVTDFASGQNLTTSWATYSVTGTVSSASVKNLAVAFWTDSAITAGTTISLSELELCDGNVARDWLVGPGDLAADRLGCERFYEKSYEIDTAPGSASAPGFLFFWNGTVANNTYVGGGSFKVRKRVAPTVSVWGYAGGSSVVSNASGTDLAASSGNPSNAAQTGFTITNNSGGNVVAATGGFWAHWSASAEL